MVGLFGGDGPKDGATLMDLATHGDYESKRSCAAALKSLSGKSGFHDSMVKAGAVDALLTLYVAHLHAEACHATLGHQSLILILLLLLLPPVS